MKHLAAIVVVILLVASVHAQTPQICNNGLPCESEPTMSLPSIDTASLTVYVGTGSASVAGTMPENATSQLVFAAVTGRFNSESPVVAFTPPSGWTLITAGLANAQDSFTYVVSGLYFRVGTGTPSSVTWSFNQTAVDAQLIMGVINNVALSSWEADSKKASYLDEANTANQSIAGVTTAIDNCLLIAVFAADGVTSPDPTGPLSMSLDVLSANNSEISIYEAVQGAAGASGTKAIVYPSGSGIPGGAHSLVALKPFAGPSIPTLISPARLGTNDAPPTITIGAAYNITWTQSTSPTAAQSSLKYHIQHSSDNGVSWADVVALTSAGVGSYSWSTTGLTAGSTHQIRIEANDPATSLNSLAYDYSKTFTLVVETAPAPPTSLSPSGGAVDKATAATPFAWLHSGGAGNPQTKFTLQWSRDAFASHTATVGPTTTTTQSTTVNLSGEADGATITWRVKTTGLTLDSAYSSNASFIAANAPATPNITAPTAGSPPTDPNPTYVFTESSAFTHRRLRLTVGGSQVYDSGFVSGTGLSFPSVYSLANGVAYTAYLSVRNQYGLISAEDSETFTPTFTGPATPTIIVTPSNNGGFNRVQISNAGSPAADYNEVYRFAAGQTSADFIRVGKAVPLNSAFDDYNVRSGIQYSYKARAVISATLKFTDSTTSTGTVTLTQGFIHVVDRG